MYCFRCPEVRHQEDIVTCCTSGGWLTFRVHLIIVLKGVYIVCVCVRACACACVCCFKTNQGQSTINITQHLPVFFGRDTKNRWSLLSGVYARGSKRSHTGGKCVTCSGLANCRLTLNALQRAPSRIWEKQKRKKVKRKVKCHDHIRHVGHLGHVPHVGHLHIIAHAQCYNLYLYRE